MTAGWAALSVEVSMCGGGRTLSGNLLSVCVVWPLGPEQSLDVCSSGPSSFACFSELCFSPCDRQACGKLASPLPGEAPRSVEGTVLLVVTPGEAWVARRVPSEAPQQP